jgi:hypothetical protein
VWPELECFLAQALQLDLLAVGEVVLLADGDAHDLAPDRLLADLVGVAGQRRQWQVAGAGERVSDFLCKRVRVVGLRSGF